MSKVYQCDKCGRIFEPRVLQNGEPYITRKVANKGRVNNSDIDLCPECYDSLLAWLKTDDDEYKCSTCKFRYTSPSEIPCKVCSCCWSDKYEKVENEH
jgi:methionyl-tRNA synthetase